MPTMVKKTAQEVAALKKQLAEAEEAQTQETEVREDTNDDLDAQIAKLQAAKRKRDIEASAGLLENFLHRFVTFVKDAGKIQVAHPKWVLPFTMRSDNILYNAVLARGKASPQDVMDDIGEYLPSLLAKDIKTSLAPDPLTWITNTLGKKSRREETGKDKDGNTTYSRPEYKDNKDGTYSILE